MFFEEQVFLLKHFVSKLLYKLNKYFVRSLLFFRISEKHLSDMVVNALPTLVE